MAAMAKAFSVLIFVAARKPSKHPRCFTAPLLKGTAKRGIGCIADTGGDLLHAMTVFGEQRTRPLHTVITQVLPRRFGYEGLESGRKDRA